jgi:predicted nucleic acid-binding protein
MKTAVDTNVIVALWDRDERLSRSAEAALLDASRGGRILIAAPVFAELLAAPGRGEAFLFRFLQDTSIEVDWEMDETIWRMAGRAFRDYAARRKLKRESGPRRILADFLIGAHAVRRCTALLTLDDRVYRASFPDLQLIRP